MATLPFLFDADVHDRWWEPVFDDGGRVRVLALAGAGTAHDRPVRARVRTGKGYWLAAICLSLTLASHVLPWIFSLGAIAVLVVFELMYRAASESRTTGMRR